MSRRLAVSLLGSFQVSLDENVITQFESDKVRGLLAYLLVEADRAHSRESVATLFWTEYSECAARNNLRQALFKLRQSLGDQDAAAPFLLATRKTIQFNPNSNCWLDVTEFAALVSACFEHPHRYLRTCSSCIQRLSLALKLYRGDFLKGLFISGSIAFEEWALLRREELHNLALRAAYHLAGHHEQRGEYEQAIQYTRKRLELEPWQEEGHQQLMRVLGLNGQRSEALAQYEICRVILAEELGIEPTEQTTRLYEKVKAQGVIPSLPRHNLPFPTTPFIGRTQELARLETMLQNPAYRLITITGAGGAGKTRLALAAAKQVAGSFAQGVWVVPLAQLTGSDSAGQQRACLNAAISNSLNLSFSGNQDPQTQLLDYLRDRETLLLLDNLEHLLAESIPLVLKILHKTAHVTLLITSRERLNLQAEYVLQLAGLPVPTSAADRAAADYGGIRLFAERADRAPTGFQLDATNLPEVVQLCQLVEGLPLGIELAAAWWGQVNDRRVLLNLKENLNLFTTTMQDVPPRHRSMSAVFESSWQLLAAEERRVLAQLSIFQGGFSAAAARAVAAAEPTTLYSLTAKSLLRQTTAARYEMHELLQQFAREKLSDMSLFPEPPPDASNFSLQEKHSTYYLYLIAEKEAALYGIEPQSTVAELRREVKNIWQAWRWATTHGNITVLERSITGLARLIALTGLFQEGETAFRKAVERIAPFAAPAQHPSIATLAVWGRLLCEQARFSNDLALFAQAIAAAQRAIAVAGDINLSPLEASGFLQWGIALSRQGDFSLARHKLERALELARAAAFRQIEIDALRHLGATADGRGDFARANSLYTHALQLCRAVGAPLRESSVLNDLGITAAKQGNYAAARTHFEQALTMYRVQDNPHGESNVLNNLGVLADLLGDYAQGKEYLERALRLARELGDRQAEGEILTDLGLLSYHLGDHAAARRYSSQALLIAQGIGDRSIQGYALTHLGHALLGLGLTDEATANYRQAVDIRQSAGQHHLAVESLTGMARAALAQGHLPLAQVEAILGYLNGNGAALEGIEEPYQIYLTCYQVLTAREHSRAKDLLITAYNSLQEWAGKIEDEQLRYAYLTNVAAHRAICAEYAQVVGNG